MVKFTKAQLQKQFNAFTKGLLPGYDEENRREGIEFKRHKKKQQGKQKKQQESEIKKVSNKEQKKTYKIDIKIYFRFSEELEDIGENVDLDKEGRKIGVVARVIDEVFTGTKTQLKDKINKLIANGKITNKYNDYEVAKRKTRNGLKDAIDVTTHEMIGNREINEHQYINYNRNMRIKDYENEYTLDSISNIHKIPSENDSCTSAFIRVKFPELYSEYKYYEQTREINVDNFIEFLEKHDISYKIFDIYGSCLFKCDRGNKFINALVYQDHIYSLIGDRIIKRECRNKNLRYVKDVKKEFGKLLRSNIIPRKIKLIGKKQKNTDEILPLKLTIESFNYDDINYYGNDEYKYCKDFLEFHYKKLNKDYKLGFLKENVKINSIIDIILKLSPHKTQDLRSYIPDCDKYAAFGFLWKSKREVPQNAITDDKNKCYSWALATLPRLIAFDYRRDNITVYNGEEIEDYNLYLVEPKKRSFQFPNTRLYAGYYIKKFDQIEITIKEVLHCRNYDNSYAKIIPDLYDSIKEFDNKEGEKNFKIMMNVHIGKMEMKPKKEIEYQFKSIQKSKDAGTTYYSKFGKHYIFYDPVEKIKNITNYLPISIQVKDHARLMILQRIGEQMILEENIYQINTDSITYVPTKKPTDLDPNNIRGWKKSTYNPINDQNYIYPENGSLIKPEKNNKLFRLLNEKYAGSGKTTSIVNKLEWFKTNKEKNITSIILTPTHETLNECRKLGINNCEIIHKYIYSGRIPTEDYVIIDEIGLLDDKGHDFMLKLFYSEKQYICYGDFKQLSISKIDFNQPHYLNYLFNEFDSSFTNYRNNFTKENYDDLIYNYAKPKLIKEVKKWSKEKPEDAELILSFKRSTMKKYNEYMLNYHKKEFKVTKKKVIISEGLRIRCETNDFIDKNLFNGTILEVIGQISPTEVHLFNIITDEIHILSPIELIKFQPAYALNIHRVQGKTLKSYYWCEEDNYYITNRVAYTVISRLKQ